MVSKVLKYILILLNVLGLIITTGCATGHCRGRKEPSTPKKVFVFKADESKQCDKKSGVSVEAMAAQLYKIKVYSQKKSKDGMMRMTVCGASTGQINVYEIAETDQELALSYGFKKLEQKEELK